MLCCKTENISSFLSQFYVFFKLMLLNNKTKLLNQAKYSSSVSGSRSKGKGVLEKSDTTKAKFKFFFFFF